MTTALTTTTTRPQCGVYLRISDDPGNDELGVKRQEKWARQFCDDYSFEPVIFQDNDISATKDRMREQYVTMLKAVADGRLRAVAVWGQDRLCREPAEFEDFRKLAKASSVLLATRAGIKNLARAADTFNARNEVNAASYEVANMVERMKERFVELSAEGRAWWPHRPFAYTMPQKISRTEWTRPELVKSEAAALKKAYSNVLAGVSLKAIARQWNAKGILTPKGKEWSGMAVRQLLLAARNAGLRTYQPDKSKPPQIVGTGNWPPVVKEDIWRGVVAKLTDSTRRSNGSGFQSARKYLLSGIACCAECGQPVTGATRGRDRRTPVYQCKNFGCLRVARQVAPVDAWVTAHVVEYLAASDPAELFNRGGTVDVAGLLDQANALRARQDELAGMFAAGTVNASQLATGTAALTEQIAALDRELLDANKSHELEGLVGVADVAERFAALPLDRQRAVIVRLVSVVIHPGQPSRRPFDSSLVVVTPRH